MVGKTSPASTAFFVSVMASLAFPSASAAEETFWQERVCTQVALAEGMGLVWCADAVVRSERGLELHVSWRGFGLAGKSLHKDPDTGNRKMYLKDSKGRRYDHVSTLGASAEGGRLDDITPILRGGFVFPSVPEDEVSFTFHDDDQGLILTGISLNPAARTDPQTSATLLAPLVLASTIQIDYRDTEGTHEQFHLRRITDDFELEVVGDTSPRSVIPAEGVDAFLSTLIATPLIERRVVRRQSTDDFSGVMLELETPAGRFSFSAPNPSARTWVAETETKSYMIPDDTPTVALRELDAQLGRDPGTRAMVALAAHLGEERASEVWKRIEARLGPESGYGLARRVATLLDSEDDDGDADVLKALEEYLSPRSSTPSQPASVASSSAGPVAEDPKETDSDTALLAAISAGETDTVRALLAAGASPRASNSAGEAALIIAASAGRAEIVEALLRAGADVDVLGRYRMTPLMMASERGYGQAVAALLAAGANPNLQSLDGRTALGLAAGSQQAAIVRLLLGAKADPNLAETGGETPLMLARVPTVARALLRAGARVNAKDERGLTALMQVVAGDSPGATRRVAVADRVATVRELLAAGADVKARDAEQRTALLWAAKGVPGGETFADLLPPLLEAGSDVNARDTDGGTALFYVVLRGDVAATRSLIDAGADVNARVGSRSPMDIAIRSGFTEITPLLLRAGARR